MQSKRLGILKPFQLLLFEKIKEITQNFFFFKKSFQEDKISLGTWLVSLQFIWWHEIIGYFFFENWSNVNNILIESNMLCFLSSFHRFDFPYLEGMIWQVV